MSTFKAQEEIAFEVLGKTGRFIVYKVTRAGTTITLVLVALRKGMKVVVFVPTKKLAAEIIDKVSALFQKPLRVANIGPNSEICKKLDPSLKMHFQFKEDCSKCELLGNSSECVFQNLLMNDFDLCVISYAKLQALQLSQSKDAITLLQKVASADVFIFDEFTTVLLSNTPTITLINPDDKYYAKSDLRFQIGKIANKGNLGYWFNVFETFSAMFENKKSGVYENNAWNYTLFGGEETRKQLFFDAWKEIKNATLEGKKTSKLQDVFLATFAEKIVINNEDGYVHVTPTVDDSLQYLKGFVRILDEGKRVFIVDSRQPRSVDFESLFGKVISVLWGAKGDPLRTNTKQLIITDTAHWGARDFIRDYKLWARVKPYVELTIREFTPQNVIIVTTNKEMTGIVLKWNLPKEVRITWFRSDWMRGVPVEGRRIMICIGGPYVPMKAHLPESQSFKFEDFAKQLDNMTTKEEKSAKLALLLRADNICSEFINAIGRVKDPQGIDKSLVITLGMQLQEVQAMLRQNTVFEIAKPRVTQALFGGALLTENPIVGKLWMYDDVETPLQLSVLARIVNITNEKGQVSASQVILGRTELVKDVANRYQQLLRKYGVKVLLKQGGMSFEKA